MIANMTLAWMLSSVCVAVLIAAAALCVERVLMLRRGTPVRWVWLAAMAVSIAWPVRWLRHPPLVIGATLSRALEPIRNGATPTGDVASLSTAPLAMRETTPDMAQPLPWWSRTIAQWPSMSERTNRIARMTWLSCSFALLLALAWSAQRLHRDRQRWTHASVAGTSVLVSNGFGPAIVGLWRAAMVVPSWVLTANAATQRTIVLHEAEHRRAGDQWLLLASFVALIVAPWNVVLWLMRRRLARAIELDCDERVLAHGVEAASYATVLLHAWEQTRHVAPWIPSPALTEPVSRLSGRVEHLLRPTPRRRVMKSIAGVFATVTLLGVTALVPRPQQAQSFANADGDSGRGPMLPVDDTVPVLTEASGRSSATRRMLTPLVARSATVDSVRAGVAQIEVPRVTLQPDDSSAATPPVQPKRARIAVIVPAGPVGTLLAQEIHQALQADTTTRSLYPIPPADIWRTLSAAGFATTHQLLPVDVRALGNLMRADLVVSLALDGGPNLTARVDALIRSVRDSALRPLVTTAGTVRSLSESIVRALKADSAYARLVRPLADTTTALSRIAVVAPGSMGPAYPAEMSRNGVSGDVVARFVVDTNGRVDESTIAVLASDRPQFSMAVIQSLSRMRFIAAERDGVKVRQPVHVGYQFSNNGTSNFIRIVTDDNTIRAIRERFNARGALE